MKYKNAHSFFAILLAFVTAITSCGCSFFAKDNPEDILATFKDGTVFCETYNNFCEENMQLKLTKTVETPDNLEEGIYFCDALSEKYYVSVAYFAKEINVLSFGYGINTPVDSDLVKSAEVLFSMLFGCQHHTSQK